MFDREQHTLNLPAVNSITYVLRFLEKLCHNLRSDNLFGNQPFTQNSHMQRSHEYDHDRYLPGRSWGGGCTVGTQVLRVLTQIFISISGGGRRVFQSPLTGFITSHPVSCTCPQGSCCAGFQLHFLPVSLVSISAVGFRSSVLSPCLPSSPHPPVLPASCNLIMVTS